MEEITQLEYSLIDIKVEQVLAKLPNDQKSIGFLYLMLEALFPRSEEEISSLITDGGNDRGADAIHIRETGDSTYVSIVQSKYAHSIKGAGKNFPGNEIDKLNSLITDIINKTDGLQEASGITSRTLASLEMCWKNGYSLLQPNDILVIDEVGMVGTRQMARFVKETQRHGAKLVLVGDPEQLQPINAGTPFLDITEQIDTAKLIEVRRQNEDWQKQATLDFAQNRTGEALIVYADHGAVEFCDTRSEAIATLVQDYMVDLELRGVDASRLALAHRRKDVHAINQAIRMAHKLGGELKDEKLFKTDHGPRAFATGDRIMFTKNDAELGVRNGRLGTIETVCKNQLTVCLDTVGSGRHRRLTFLPDRYTAIDHGYATTIHKSQGATVDSTFVLSSRRMDRHLTYVAMSRHRNSAKLYVDGSGSSSTGKKNNLPYSKSKALVRQR